MASKPENVFIAGVEKHLPKDIYRLKLNLPYTGGVPDKWYSGTLSDLWVEYKYVPKLPVRAALTLDLSELQLQWLRQRYAEGRNVSVILGHPGGGVMFRELEWEESFQPQIISDRTVQRKDLAVLIASLVNGVEHGDQVSLGNLSST